MKWLMTLIVGALLGAGVLFVLLSDRSGAPTPEVVATAPPLSKPGGVPASLIEGQLPPAPVVEPTLIDADLPLRPELAAGETPASPATVPGKLLVPVQGIRSTELTDTFYQPRGEQRQHEALDILAPTGTPVVATADGKVVKLFQSKPGGLTVYQFDPSEQYAYYYAHTSTAMPTISRKAWRSSAARSSATSARPAMPIRARRTCTSRSSR